MHESLGKSGEKSEWGKSFKEKEQLVQCLKAAAV